MCCIFGHRLNLSGLGLGCRLFCLNLGDGLALGIDFLLSQSCIFFLADKAPLVAKPLRGEVLADRVRDFVAVEFAVVFFVPEASNLRNSNAVGRLTLLLHPRLSLVGLLAWQRILFLVF